MKLLIRTYKSLILFGLMQVILISCSGGDPKLKKLSPEQIESKFASGVVLIKTDYCYSMTFSNGAVFYFTGIDSEGNPENMTLDPNEVKFVTVLGTGFFISKDGYIATNSHVVSPPVDIYSVRSNIVNAFTNMGDAITKDINSMNERLSMIRIAIMSAEDYYDRRQYQQAYDELEKERDEAQDFVNLVRTIGTMDYEANIHTEIGIAYNDTHVTNTTDFIDCVTVANDPEHDLAILQLKDKKTPDGKHIFNLTQKANTKDSDKDNDSEKSKKKGVKVGQKLYMIGYNLGTTIALTNEGIKAQVTSGEVSQNTDENKILYTIPALHGSSGSPVLNEYGKIVAINFAGFNDSQNFNYGIKVKHLIELYKKVKSE